MNQQIVSIILFLFTLVALVCKFCERIYFQFLDFEFGWKMLDSNKNTCPKLNLSTFGLDNGLMPILHLGLDNGLMPILHLGLDNGLMPILHQSITWTNVSLSIEVVATSKMKFSGRPLNIKTPILPV